MTGKESAAQAENIRVSDLTEDQRQASSDLVTATRQLMHDVAVAEVDANRMRAAEQTITEVRKLLGTTGQRIRTVRTNLDGPAQARAVGPDASWQAFQHNPRSAPLDMHFEGDSAYARFSPDGLYEGPQDSLQGGLSAYLMDV